MGRGDTVTTNDTYATSLSNPCCAALRMNLTGVSASTYWRMIV